MVRAYLSRQAELRQEPVIDIHPPATGNIVEAITPQAQPQTMHYSPGMVPAPVLLRTGETLYPGETTVITPEPVFHVPATDSTVAPATGNVLLPGTGSNLGSSPPNSGATIRSRCGSSSIGIATPTPETSGSLIMITLMNGAGSWTTRRTYLLP